MNVLILGGCGTLGRELVSLLYGKEHAITTVSRDEEKQKQFARDFPITKRIIGDCGDPESVREFMGAAWPIDLLIHCAAMKHVDVCEENPAECARINVMGTQYVRDACRDLEVESAIFISSDKSVEPISVYGASKLLAERIWLKGRNGQTRASVVRSGNMIGSRGSIIPIWKALAEAGKDIPVTHPDMLRYWIKPEKLARFVLDRALDMIGGETFIPDCEPRLAMNVAKEINSLFGNKSKIVTVGLRPGEKLVEKLIGDHEKALKTDWGYKIVA